MVENDNQTVDTQPAATGEESGPVARQPERSSRSYQSRSGGRGGRSDDRGRGSRDRRGRRPNRGRRGKKVCTFCADKISVIDYKDVNLLRNFVSEHGKIKARRRTGTCAKHQRRLALAIKRARHVAFLPYSAEHARGR